MSDVSTTRRALLGAGLAAGLGANAIPVAQAAAPPAQLPLGIPARSLGLVAGRRGDQTGAFTSALEKAAERGLPLLLEPGTYRLGRVTIERPVAIAGAAGASVLEFTGPKAGLIASDTDRISLSGLVVDGRKALAHGQNQGLVHCHDITRVEIAACLMRRSPAHAIALEHCGGRVSGCELADAGDAAVFSLDADGLEISANHIHDCANNAVLVWKSGFGEDGTLVRDNRIARIRADAGGSGQNGNGVNVFRAGNVMITNNRITDCAFSAVRANEGSMCQMIGNSCARLSETALYSEFGFEGAMISNNIVEQAQTGISVTNFDVGGRLAVCSGNIIRNLVLRDSDWRTVGISVQADTIVTSNTIEAVPHIGINLGWGRYLRDCIASNNVLRDCGIAIAVQVVEGAGKASISGNIIAKAEVGAIMGMDHKLVVTGDLARGSDARAANVSLSGNIVS